MTKWRFKSCPRCGGDLFVENDMDRNWYEQCLQCAFRRQITDTVGLKEQPIRPAERTPVHSGVPDEDALTCV